MNPIGLWDLYAIVLTSSLFFYIRYKWNRRRFDAMGSKLPGPKPLPFIGNVLQFIKVTRYDFIYKISELAVHYWDFGLLRIWFGPILVVGIYKPEHMEAILCNPKNTDKSLLFSFFQPRSKGAFSLSGEMWRRKRRLANRMFHSGLLENFIDIFNEQGLILMKYLKEKSLSGECDLSRPLMRYTLSVICQTALGVKINVQDDENLTFPEDLTKSSETIVERAYKPWLYPTFIFKMTKTGKEMFKQCDNIHQFTISVIKKRKELLEKENKSCDSQSQDLKATCDRVTNKVKTTFYLDALLETAKEEKLSDLEIALEALDVIIGGMDTSAIADCYVLLMLGIHKDWQDKVHKEIDEIFENTDRHVTMSDLGKLVCLEMVIKEVLRLYTAPHSVRLLTEDIKLDNYVLPAGTIVYLSTFVLHRVKMFWSNPDEFYPEHFLPENIAARPKYSYLPFSTGPRGCPGSRYGMVSMKVILVHILRSFNVDCNLKFKDLKYKPSLMLELDGGYPIRLIPRKSS